MLCMDSYNSHNCKNSKIQSYSRNLSVWTKLIDPYTSAVLYN